MLKGVPESNDKELAELIKDSQEYFKETSSFLSEQVDLLMTRAVANTRYLTAYLYKVALKNIEKSADKLSTLQSKNDPKLPEKLLQYLSRTHEFVALRTRNSSDSATFIPVPFHKQFAQIHQQKLDQCEKLLARAQKLVKPNNQAPKSWFSSFLFQANTLPNIWAAGYGLGNDDPVAPSKRLYELNERLIALEQTSDNDVKVTNCTKKMLDISSFTAEPGVDSDYHKHVPSMTPIMTSFKNFMKQQKETQAPLTKENVHESIATVYPKPF